MASLIFRDEHGQWVHVGNASGHEKMDALHNTAAVLVVFEDIDDETFNEIVDEAKLDAVRKGVSGNLDFMLLSVALRIGAEYQVFIRVDD